MRKLQWAAGILLSFSVIAILLISSFEIAMYADFSVYQREYEKYDVLSDLPDMTMSEEDGLMAVTEHMMHYLRGDEGYDDLQIEVRMGGELRGFFTDREIAHMKDVRDLFVGAQRLRLFAAVICLICLVSMYLILRKEFLYVFSRSLLIGTGILFLLLAILAGILAADFSSAFVTFHHIFFDNDLWILDPRVDMLINIVPEGFFFDTAFRIAAIFGAGTALLLICGAVGTLKTKKRNRS